MNPDQINKTVSRLREIDNAASALEEERKILAKQICDMGRGRYAGAGCECQVIEVSGGKPSYKPLLGKNLDRAKEIAGETFGKVFDRKVIFAPCSSFADVVAKVCSKAIAAKLIALCEKPGKAGSVYLKWC